MSRCPVSGPLTLRSCRRAKGRLPCLNSAVFDRLYSMRRARLPATLLLTRMRDGRRSERLST